MKTSDPDSFTSEFYQILKQAILPIIHNLIEKIEAEGILPSITITPKPNKEIF